MLGSVVEIIGHEKITSFFERALTNNRLAQAYLFVGPEGVGKTTVAEWLIKKLLGAQGLNHPDAISLTRLVDEKTEKIKSEIIVGQVRDLRERLSMTGLMGEKKVAFIEEAGALNIEAANALLKTLEEPTNGTVIILRSSSIDQVLPTIVSRCQIIRFSLVTQEKIISSLIGRGVSKKEAGVIAGLSNGCPGLAFRLLYDEATRSLEEVSVARFLEVLQTVRANRLSRATEWLPKDENNKSEQLKDLLNRWERLLREILLTSLGIRESTGRVTAHPDLEKKVLEKTYCHWLMVLEKLRTIKNDLAFHVNPTLALEQLLLVL